MKIVFISVVIAAIASQAHAISCEGCTPEEMTALQLHQIKDTVEILKSIEDLSSEIPPSALRLYLSRFASQAEVDALVGTEVKPVVANNTATKPKPTKATTKVSTKTKGYDELLVAHAQAARPDINFKASAILVSLGKPNPVGIGDSFEHKGDVYTLNSVTEYENADGTIGVAVVIKNTKSGVNVNLPWNIN